MQIKPRAFVDGHLDVFLEVVCHLAVQRNCRSLSGEREDQFHPKLFSAIMGGLMYVRPLRFELLLRSLFRDVRPPNRVP